MLALFVLPNVDIGDLTQEDAGLILKDIKFGNLDFMRQERCKGNSTVTNKIVTNNGTFLGLLTLQIKTGYKKIHKCKLQRIQYIKTRMKRKV